MSVTRQLLRPLSALALLRHGAELAGELLRRAQAGDPDLKIATPELGDLAQIFIEVERVLGDDAIATGAIDPEALDTRVPLDAITIQLAQGVAALYRLRSDLAARFGVIDPSIRSTIDRALRGALADAARLYADAQLSS